MRIKATKFDPGKNPETSLLRTKVTAEDGAVHKFPVYLDSQLRQFENLKHPTKDFPWALQDGVEMRWRQFKDVWTTYGYMAVDYYCVEDRQVRASLYYDSDRIRHPHGNFSEISWHLDETDVVLPALLMSLDQFSYLPLASTGLFDTGFPATPAEHVYIWTHKGYEVCRSKSAQGTQLDGFLLKMKPKGP